MLRVYFLQQWYALADEALEDALYDSQALQRFARIELEAEGSPDAATLLNVPPPARNQRPVQSALHRDQRRPRRPRPAAARRDAGGRKALIAAPCSAKNKKRARDPDMHQTKKGNQWHFEMKAHIGADRGNTAGAHCGRHRRGIGKRGTEDWRKTATRSTLSSLWPTW
jgi:IS5 family transposase